MSGGGWILKELIKEVEELRFEKGQWMQKEIDLKAQLKYAKREFRELNEELFKLQTEVSGLKPLFSRRESQDKLERYEKAIDELEESFESFGEITGDRRFVEWVRLKKEKYSI